MKKKIVLSISVISLALFTGCGGGSSNNSNNTVSASTSTEPSKTVKVVDAYVIGAKVCDAKGTCVSTEANGTAKAAFANTILTATSGYIDVNNNNQIDDSDIKLPDTFSLKTPAGKSIISPITDLIANGANPAQLAKVLGIDEAKLYDDPIATNNVELAKAIQIVYALKVEGKEKELIEKINNYTFTPKTDLPNFDNDTTTAKPTSKEETNTTSVTTDLPVFKVATDLPNFDDDTTTAKPTSKEETTVLKGSLALFANIASSIASTEAKNLITAVVDSTDTSAIALEKSIANLKKELIKTEEATETAKEETKTEEATETAKEEMDSKEVNATAETTSKETNTTTKESETKTEETTSEKTTTTSSDTDLPVFDD